MNAEYEKKFCPKEFVAFSDLEIGIERVNDTIKYNNISAAS